MVHYNVRDNVRGHADIAGIGSFPVAQFHVVEALSELPVYVIEISESIGDLNQLISKKFTFELPKETYNRSSKETTKEFAGIVFECEQTVSPQGIITTVLRGSSALSFLQHSYSSCVYQNKTVLDIFSDILKRNGLSTLKLVKRASVNKRDLVIQYNENDYDFIHRLFSEEGLVFYFDDGKDPSTIVIHDASRPFKQLVSKPIALTSANVFDETRLRIEAPTIKYKAQVKTVGLTGYDEEKAKKDKIKPLKTGGARNSLSTSYQEYVAHPTEQRNTSRSKSYQADEITLIGTVEHYNLHLGQTIDIAAKDRTDLNGYFTITKIHYAPNDRDYYRCIIEAIPKKAAYHYPVQAKPLITGVHNAVVVGEREGMPDCDQYGRVKVKFFWDQSKEKTNTSNWLRVSEVYAGNGYGSQYTPRVGHEVLVSFLHGDPDAPVIVGQVYNGKNKSLFPTKNTTKTGVRSKLKNAVNELEFDDKEGAELVALRAGKNFELIVTEDAFNEIKNKSETKVGNTCKVSVEGEYDVKVKKSAALEADSQSVKVNKVISNTGDEIQLKANRKITLKVGNSAIELSPLGINITSPSVTINGKQKVSVEANGSLSLSGLTAKVNGKTKTDIAGLMVDIKGQVKVSTKAPITDLSGDGVLMIKGGIALIN